MSDAHAVHDGLSSSVEFEKGVKPGIPESAHAQAAELLLGGQQADGLRHVAGLQKDIAITAGAVLSQRPRKDRGNHHQDICILEKVLRAEELDQFFVRWKR